MNPNVIRQAGTRSHNGLINNGIKRIFYPCIPYEKNETPEANNHYNCPIVASYPENIKNNVEEIYKGKVEFHNPFMAMTNEKVLTEQLVKIFTKTFSIPDTEVRKASRLAWQDSESVQRYIQTKGEEILDMLDQTGKKGIVLAGRPYHIDHEINHGIPELITSYGVAVLTEDSVSHLGTVERPLIVLDQWMYHSNFMRQLIM